MFLVGLVAGLIGQSSGLIADSLDMFADAVAYGIALSALNRGTTFKARAAMMSGGILLTPGIGVLLDCVRRGVFGSSPESRVMMGVAGISLLVNATVLYLLGKYRDQGVHLRAAWIFTRVDVIANLAVVLSGPDYSAYRIPLRRSRCRSGNRPVCHQGRVQDHREGREAGKKVQRSSEYLFRYLTD